MASTLSFALLDLPVLLTVDDPGGECLALLRAAYAGPLGEAGETGGDSTIRASLERTGEERFFTRVTERPDATTSDPIDAVRSLNHELLHAVMLRRPEYFYVHAGVVTWGGKALVLPGLSRAGKSTLVLSLLLSGAAYLSDELLVYDVARNRALPFARSVKVREVCLPYFEGIEARTVGRGEGRFLPPGSLAGVDGVAEGAAGSAAPIGMVVAPTWDGEKATALEPITRGEALMHLTASALNFGTHREASLDHLAGMVADAGCYRLTWNEPGPATERMLEALRTGGGGPR